MNYQVCSRCVMDTTAGDIEFDENGVCNYCTDYLRKLEQAKAVIEDDIAHRAEFITKVKSTGKGKRYDCVVGVSGGVDSSYALYLAVQSGLRPLAVHLDNGWNSELAVHNISALVSSLGVDLHTHVIDWPENRDLQLSFFKAHVVDIEMLMDNAMKALNYEQAAKHGLRYILAGTNSATEGMKMPPGWNHYKRDVKNIRRIHRRFGTERIKSHPLFSTLDWVVYERIRGIQWVSFLDYFDYNKERALAVLKEEVGYKPYPYKHYESVFTRFYQGHILPQKFGIDKRRVHLSTLVSHGQMSRADAMTLLSQSPYPDPEQLEQDRTFVLKKLGMSDDEFQAYLRHEPVPHDHYGSELGRKRMLTSLRRTIRNPMTFFQRSP